MWELWDRVVRNLRTSMVAIVAGAVIIAKWFGVIIVPDEVIIVLAAIEAFILLFARD